MSNHILIIDDEKHIRRMMRLTLEAAGYAVDEAHDGHEGLKLYGDGSEWDVVVLDQRMPGMDGLETLRRIRTSDPRARIVMATAYASIELAVDAMKLGASDFVRKPMTPETLRAAVKAALFKPKKELLQSEAAGVDSDKPAATASIIPTITMNGFELRHSEGPAKRSDAEHFFNVKTPAGEQLEVAVEIEESVIEFVKRMSGRTLPPNNPFWALQAERLLADYLWNEGRPPASRRLTLKDIPPNEIHVAAAWEVSKSSN